MCIYIYMYTYVFALTRSPKAGDSDAGNAASVGALRFGRLPPITPGRDHSPRARGR